MAVSRASAVWLIVALCAWHNCAILVRHPRHIACIERAAMTTGEGQPSTEATELRRQEMEFYQAIMAVLAAMPRGSTVSDAIASEPGRRARAKWALKYGREAPL